MPAAKQNYEEALKLRGKIAEKQTEAETQVHLAEVLLDEGTPLEAMTRIQAAMKEFQKEDDVDDQIFAGATLAAALL
jgi:hypothetical protein